MVSTTELRFSRPGPHTYDDLKVRLVIAMNQIPAACGSYLGIFYPRGFQHFGNGTISVEHGEPLDPAVSHSRGVQIEGHVRRPQFRSNNGRTQQAAGSSARRPVE